MGKFTQLFKKRQLSEVWVVILMYKLARALLLVIVTPVASEVHTVPCNCQRALRERQVSFTPRIYSKRNAKIAISYSWLIVSLLAPVGCNPPTQQACNASES
jgi:hypothetical protein